MRKELIVVNFANEVSELRTTHTTHRQNLALNVLSHIYWFMRF